MTSTSSPTGAGFFSHDFATARERFRAAANATHARLEELPLGCKGPAGESLGIDIAWLGDERPRRVLLHSSGLHGVEGFTGSAIQLDLLARPLDIPAGAAVVFLHVLNPYGMAWLRRFNDSNVDLNRNFLAPGEEFRGAPEAYRKLNGLLNPTTPPQRLDGFLPRAAGAVLRYGFRNLKQAVAEGQYEFPRGIFFGGEKLEATAVALPSWMETRLADIECVFAIDVHTGLGQFGEDSLLTEYASDSEKAHRLRERLGPRVQTWTKTGVAYQIRGGFLQALERVLPHADVTGVCQEFGTYSPLRVLHALREENRLHHWGNAGQMDHPARRRLVEAFCPRSAVWRSKVLDRGRSLFASVLADFF